MRYLMTLGIVWFLSLPAGADFTVVRRVRVEPHTAEGTIEVRGVTQVQGKTSRKETDVHVDGFELSREFAYSPRTVTLVSLEQGVVYRLDSQQQGFEKFSLSGWRKYLDRRQDQAAQINASPLRISQSWSRLLPDTEQKTVRNVRCKKFVYEWHFQVENPEAYSKKEYCVRTTLWLAGLSAPIQQTLREEAAFRTAYHKKLGAAPLEDLNGVTLQYAENVIGVDKHTLFMEISAGTARLKKISGYPIASQTEWMLVGTKSKKPLFTVHAELEALSLTPLAAAVFNPTTTPLNDSDYTARMISRAK